MVIVLIRTKLRPEADRAAYTTLNERMFELIQTMPGFIVADGYASSDGDEVGVIRFTTLEALRAWREHPDHLATRQVGVLCFVHDRGLRGRARIPLPMIAPTERPPW